MGFDASIKYEIDENTWFYKTESELRSFDSPEHKLLAAIVYRALQDLDTNVSKEDRRSAKTYFSKPMRLEHWGSFAYCCHILNINNPEVFREFARQEFPKVKARFPVISTYNARQ